MSVRTTTLRAATVLGATAIACLPLAGVASAAPDADRDCADFSSQSAAQAAFDADPSDPERLDRDNDGVACETYDDSSATSPSPGDASSSDRSSATTEPAQVVSVPSGGVETGDGSATGGTEAEAAGAFVLAGFGAVAASGAAVAVRRARRPVRDRG